MTPTPDLSNRVKQAELIREACIKAAKEGFMDASISGLCTDGAIEAAISAIQNLDISKVIDNSKT